MNVPFRSFPAPSNALRTLTTAILIGFALLYTGWITYVIAADRPLDFYTYLLAAAAFAQGEDPYTMSSAAQDMLAGQMGVTHFARVYRYPPHTALLLLPLLQLPPQGAALVWVTLNALALVAGAWFLATLYPHPYSRPLALGLMLCSVPPLATLLAGQVVGLLYLTTVLGLVWLARSQVVRSGLALAIGSLLKLLPLALILYLFWRQQWRAGLVAAGLLGGLFVLATPLAGLDGMQHYLANAIALGGPDTVIADPVNQTLTAWAGRSFAALSSDQIVLVGRIASLAIVLLTAAVCVPLGTSHSFLVREAALIVAALQMVAPFTWYLQLVMLHIPLFVTLMTLLPQRRKKTIAAVGLLAMLSNLHGLFWRPIAESLGNGWWMSTPLFLTLLLWACLATDIVTEKQSLRRKTAPAQN